MVISDCTFTGNEARGAAGGDGGETTAPAFGQSGAVDTSGNTTILRCIFRDNRAIGGTLLPGVTPSFDTVSAGGGIENAGKKLARLAEQMDCPAERAESSAPDFVASGAAVVVGPPLGTRISQ